MLGLASEAEAQEFNEEMKRKLRESLITPELNPSKQKIAPVELQPLQKQDEVLKVSPTTKLPTRFDRFELLQPISPEKQVHINLNVTNALPLNVRSPGSVTPVFDGKQIHIRSNAGEVVKPSGRDLDPVRAIQRHKARKRQEKVNKIIKAYE